MALQPRDPTTGLFPASTLDTLSAALCAHSGATSLMDGDHVGDLLAQWFMKNNHSRRHLHGVMSQLANIPAIREARDAAVKAYAKSILPPLGVIERILNLGTAKRSFRILSAYLTKVCRNTPGHVHRPICTRTEFSAEWVRLLHPLELDAYKHTLNPPTVGVSWPQGSWVKYLKSQPPLYIAIDFFWVHRFFPKKMYHFYTVL